MFGFPNLDDEVPVYLDKEILFKYRKGDIIKVILYEKPTYESVISIDVQKVCIEKFTNSNEKVWRVNVTLIYNTMMGSGSELIENLDQKVRDIKINKLIYGT